MDYDRRGVVHFFYVEIIEDPEILNNVIKPKKIIQEKEI